MEPAIWRNTMGKFATGVTIITTIDLEGQPLGMTANAFTSLSLDPPLVLICVDNKSETLGMLLSAKKYAVNILSDGQEALSRQFARKGGAEKFEGVAYRQGALGLPMLEGALVTIACTVKDVLQGGDHLILVGQGVALEEDPSADQPLLFYRGKYAALQKAEA